MHYYKIYIFLFLFIASITPSSQAFTLNLSTPEVSVANTTHGSANLAGNIQPQATEYVATWTYSEPIEIYDYDSTWNVISCDPNGTIPTGNSVTKVEITHSYTHTYIGDLDIQLLNDTSLWAIRTSDVDNDSVNLNETVINTTVFTGDDPNQIWFYQFRDILEEDTGWLNELTLKVYYSQAEPDISLDISQFEIDCSGINDLTPASSQQYISSAAAPVLLDQEKIENMINLEGSARVIVNLKQSLIANSKTTLTNGRSTKQYRTMVKELRDSVLNELQSKSKVKIHYEYDNIPSFSASLSIEQINQLLANKKIDSIQPVKTYKCFTAQGLPLMNALDSRSANSGSGISIAVCDTGIDYTHPMLGGSGFPNDKVIGGYDFGDNDTDPMPYSEAHGTACAGIAAGFIGSHGDYIGGVAPGAKIYALKVAQGSDEIMYDDAIAASWDWCVTNQYADPQNPIMVISVSLGGSSFSSNCDNYTSLLSTAAQNAANAGISIIAASGNEGYCDSIAEPACISSIISVGAVYDRSLSSGGWCVEPDSCIAESDTSCDSEYICYDTSATPGEVNCYSNSANILDLLAPSYAVTTTDITGSDGYDSSDYTTGFAGTSAATPYVAGAVAVIQQYSFQETGSYLSPQQVRSLLSSTGTLTYDPKSDIYTPLVNLANALDSAFPCDGESIAINNIGASTLTITGIDMPAWLTTDQLFPVDIPPAGSITICLTSDCGNICSGSISYSDSLTIYSSDPDTPSLVVPISISCAVCDSLPTGDISGDCLVDLNDFAQLAASWLTCGYYPASYCY